MKSPVRPSVRHSFLLFAALAFVACGSPTQPDSGGGDARDTVTGDIGDTGLSDALDAADAQTDAGADAPLDVSVDVRPDVHPDVFVCDATACSGACVDLQTDRANCGACGNDCASLPGVRSSAVQCIAGVCDVGSACLTGRAHCTSNPADGCEADLSQTAHCGSCTTTCADPTPLCTADTSGTYHCASGCSGATPSRCGTDCVDLQNDLAHCGACTTACTAGANATASCTAGVCGTSCNAGYSDCDGNTSNGCEVHSDVDSANCGRCGHVCVTGPHATAMCAAGTCGLACDPGYRDCDSNPVTGCEVHTDVDTANCGGCGMACNLPNAAAVCTGGMCAIGGCNPGFADCDGNPLNGCEINTLADPLHCGSCTGVCVVPNAVPACVAGMCAVGACTGTFMDCDGDVTNGCETDVAASPSNCGTCGHVCNVANASAACIGGACTVGTCNSGYSNCNGSDADGCETNTQTDPLNCGTCTHQCFAANGTAGCSGGACTVAACNSGWGNCNALAGDGCETNLTTSVGSCGACGHSCATSCTGNVTAVACVASACTVTGCAPGRFNIDGVCSNGCECATTGTSATCASPTSLGVLNVGQTVTYTGNLVPIGQQAYLQVTFAGNTNFSYHPRVRLTAGATEFAFDILSNCAGSALACGTEGGASNGKTDWEVLYTGGDPSDPANFNPIPAVGVGGVVLIHVYRRAGLPVTCNNYTLTVSD